MGLHPGKSFIRIESMVALGVVQTSRRFFFLMARRVVNYKVTNVIMSSKNNDFLNESICRKNIVAWIDGGDFICDGVELKK